MKNSAPTGQRTLPRGTERPASVVSGGAPFLGLAGFVAAAAALRGSGLPAWQMGLVAVAATAAPMIAVDLFVNRVYRRGSTGLDFDTKPSFNFTRVIIKLVGLGVTLASLALVYVVAPEYERSLYGRSFAALQYCWPVLIVFVLAYFPFVDARMSDPYDGYWLVGWRFLPRFLRDKVGEVPCVTNQRAKVLAHAGGWVIKGFYLPLMFSYLSKCVLDLASWRFESVLETAPSLVAFVSKASLGVDLAFVVVGYSVMARLIDTHVRSCNPFAWGWVVTLVLYTPFWGLVGRRYFDYNDSRDWVSFFGNYSAVLYIWAGLIIVTKVGWAWSNMSFGCRFSNLTHRGIITHGPYRFCKHPSYVFKNANWWLISVPFLHIDGWFSALPMCLGLLGVNMLYVLRAKAEEQHLSEDPTYVEYALWIEGHGWLRWIGRIVPWLRYRPPNPVLPENSAESPLCPH
jgi:isoprenylcysteine carboxyl methyltransferase (ICMT) family protein YpbQ